MLISLCMKRISGVYKIEIGGKSYVGSSVFVQQRWKQHKTDLKCGRHDNTHMQRAYNKYKEIKFELLEEMPGATDEELREKEAYYLKLYSAEFNIQDPVTNFNIKPVYQFDLEGNFLERYPDIYSAAEAVGISWSNIQHAAQENEKLTRTAGGFFWRYTRDITFEKDKRWHEIHVYSLEGEYLWTFKSSKECIKQMNLPRPKDAPSRINRVCRGLAASYGGYRYSYEKVAKLDNSKLLSIKCWFPIVRIAEDKKTKLNVFETSKVAAEILGFNSNCIADAATKERKYRGFYWTRLGTKWSELLESPEGTKATK